MAIRLIVEFVDLQVSVQTQEVVAQVREVGSDVLNSAEYNLSTTSSSFDLSVGHTTIAPISDSLISFINLNLSTNYQQINADIFIDSDTRNLYFYAGHPNAEIVNLTEATAFSVNTVQADSFGVIEQLQSVDTNLGKNETVSLTEDSRRFFTAGKTDTLSLSESSAIGFSKPATDTLSVTELHTKLFGKAATDSVSVSEALANHPGLGKADILNIADVDTKFFSMPKTDTVSVVENAELLSALQKTENISVSETSVKLISPNKSDLLTMSESLSRVVTFARTFSDTIALDDRASIADPLQTDVSLDKDNVAFMTEEHLFSISKPFTEVISISETVGKLQSKPFTETLTLSEVNFRATSLGKEETLNLSEQAVKQINLPKTESLTLSENSVRSYGLGRTETLSITENQLLAFNSAKADTVSLSEVDVISLSKVEADTFSVSESISILLTQGGSSVLNTAALNSNALN